MLLRNVFLRPLLLAAAAGPARANDGHQLWLSCHRIADMVARPHYLPSARLVAGAGTSPVRPAASGERQGRLRARPGRAVPAVAAAGSRTSGSGTGIMNSSRAAYYGLDRVVACAAARPAVEGLVKVLAAGFSTQGGRVNAIAPGFIETERSRTAMSADPDRRARAMRRTPMGKSGKPADIGHAAVFLGAEAARYVAGVLLPIDGGNSIGF
jgi:NAD(P)-dependent dehydrogenase (short-subunit alcohol dehydrogenase family)